MIRDTAPVLRGTIGAEASLKGVEPILVSGYGIVVGLNGTGGGALPEAITATMVREMTRGGVGRNGELVDGPLAGKTPQQVLADPNVAVVIVEGVISAGTPRGSVFDIQARALPGSAVTSLEGGTLWTTELRIGPVTPFGGLRARKIADAHGQILVNPYSDPAASGRALAADSTRRDIGRVLSGGVVTDPLALQIVLDNPGHSRTASMQTAINSRFPPGPGDDGPTARGKDSSTLTVRVPRMYQDRPEDFLKLLEFTQIDMALPEEYAKRYADELVRQPGMANELMWCLRALGRSAIPFVSSLYDHPEFLVRTSALRAGGWLGDPRATPFLLDIAEGKGNEAPDLRSEAIVLLGRMGTDPHINVTLRTLVNSGPLEIRVAAYEAMVERGDMNVQRFVAGEDINAFMVDMVPATDPMIYVAFQGKARIVLFGDEPRVQRPSIATVWSDRLMIEAASIPPSGSPKEANATTVRIYYKDYRSSRVVQGRVNDDLRTLIRYMAHTPSPRDPEPGLALTYSEIVGALYQIQKQQAIAGSFATARDRLVARIAQATITTIAADRPESDADREEAERRSRILEDPKRAAADAMGTGPGTGPAVPPVRSLVVPIEQPPNPKKSSDPSTGQ